MWAMPTRQSLFFSTVVKKIKIPKAKFQPTETSFGDF